MAIEWLSNPFRMLIEWVSSRWPSVVLERIFADGACVNVFLRAHHGRIGILSALSFLASVPSLHVSLPPASYRIFERQTSVLQTICTSHVGWAYARSKRGKQFYTTVGERNPTPLCTTLCVQSPLPLSTPGFNIVHVHVQIFSDPEAC